MNNQLLREAREVQTRAVLVIQSSNALEQRICQDQWHKAREDYRTARQLERISLRRSQPDHKDLAQEIRNMLATQGFTFFDILCWPR